MNGLVTSVARLGNTVYVGGAFWSAGPCTGGGVPVDLRSGEPLPPYPRVAGIVYASQPDGRGGWFIAGQFVGVGGLPRTNLAHIRADGSVAPWAPRPNDVVTKLLVGHRTLYAMGAFTEVDGRRRWYVAAFDVRSGALTPFDAQANAQVASMALGERALYLGGNFDMVGGAHRPHIGAVDVRTGTATDWNPGADLGANCLVVSGGVVYAGGDFRTIGGRSRPSLAALDATTGRVLDWNPAPWRTPDEYYNPPLISSIVPSGRAVYLGGSFETMGGVARDGLAAVDARTGAVLDWNPSIRHQPYEPFMTIHALALHGGTAYVGGVFREASGQPRSGLVALDARTGAVEAWDPRPSHPVSSLSIDGNRIYLGGGFTSVGHEWQERNCLAAFDATTGQLLDWNPGEGAGIWIIYALAARGSTVYVGGDFSRVGGQPRSNLAALDATSGLATDWNPGAGGAVWALATAGDTLYAGGIFSSLGGQSRPYVGAVDLVTGAPTAWNPSANDAVKALVVSGNRVFAGGWFSRIGGRLLNGLAALDATTGAATGWNPNPDGSVNALALGGNTLYVGGWFTSMGGQPRTFLAGVDTASGAPTPWSAGPDNEVYALATSGSTVYAGGFFATAGGMARNYLASFDGATGALTDWNPNPNGIVWSLATGDQTLYVGGAFGTMGYDPAVNLAAFAIDSVAVRPAVAGARLGTLPWSAISPNPVRSQALVHFSLPSAMPVSLTVYDAQGRRVASPLDRTLELAGEHSVPLLTDGWRAGVYFCRLQLGDVVTTKKILVLR